MMGAYLTWVAFFYLGVDPLLSILLTLPIAFVFGVAVQKLLLDAAVGAPELTGLLTPCALGLAMIYPAELIFTTDFRTIPYAPGTVQLTSAIAVGQNRVISFVLAVAISTAVYLFLKLSRLGKAVRATALNAEVAMACGIDLRRIYGITTGLAPALSVAGRAPRSLPFRVNPQTGGLYTPQAFAIICLGGGPPHFGAP